MFEQLESRTLLSVSAVIEGIPAKAVEGTAIELAGNVSDPAQAEAFSYAWDVSKNGDAYASGSGTKFSFTPDDNGAYVVKLTASSEGDTRTATQDIAVWNVAPQITIGGPSTVVAGAPYKATLTVKDPGTDTISSVMVNWGDGTGQTVAGNPGSLTHVYAQPGKYFIAITATDEDGSYYAAGPQFTVMDSGGLGAGKGTISGLVFNDANGDGVKSKADRVMARKTVFLDLNNNGVRDAGEPTAVTNSAGQYTFSDVSAGSYRVMAVAGKGWRMSGSGIRQLAVGEGSIVTDRLGLTQNSRLAGTVFADANGDGVRDAGEGVAAKVRVFLDANGDGKLNRGEKSVLTDAQGSFAFDGLSAGRYDVRVAAAKGATVTSPKGGVHRVKLAAARNVANLGFGIKR